MFLRGRRNGQQATDKKEARFRGPLDQTPTGLVVVVMTVVMMMVVVAMVPGLRGRLGHASPDQHRCGNKRKRRTRAGYVARRLLDIRH